MEGCLIKDTEMALVHLSSIFDSLLDLGTKHSMVLAVNYLYPKGTHPGLQQHHEEVDTEGGLQGQGQKWQKQPLAKECSEERLQGLEDSDPPKEGCVMRESEKHLCP